MDDEADNAAKSRQDLPDEAELTEHDTAYQARTIPPLKKRLRYWHRWRLSGIICALLGIFMMIGGAFGDSGRAMQVAGFVILAGAVLFTIGAIGGWLTRKRPLD